MLLRVFLSAGFLLSTTSSIGAPFKSVNPQRSLSSPPFSPLITPSVQVVLSNPPFCTRFANSIDG